MQIFVGFDHRTGGKAADACCKALSTFNIEPVVLREYELRGVGLYEREYKTTSDGRLFDNGDFKEFPEHYTFTKFLSPHLCKDFALFISPSIIFKEDPQKFFDKLDKTKSVSALPWSETKEKFDHKIVMFNSERCVKRISVEDVNQRSSSYLNEFKWCAAEEVGVINFDVTSFIK